MQYIGVTIHKESKRYMVFFAAAALLISIAGCGEHASLTGSKAVASPQSESWMAEVSIKSKGDIRNLDAADQQKLFQMQGRQGPLNLHQEYAALQMQGKAK